MRDLSWILLLFGAFFEIARSAHFYFRAGKISVLFKGGQRQEIQNIHKFRMSSYIVRKSMLNFIFGILAGAPRRVYTCPKLGEI